MTLAGIRAKITPALAIIGLALLITASAAARAPSHAAFVAKANALCVTEYKQISALPDPTTPKAAGVVLGKTIAIISRLRTATLALPAPAADKPLIRAAMNQIAQELGALRKARTAAGANLLAPYRTDLNQALAFKNAAAAYAGRLGLTSCAGGTD